MIDANELIDILKHWKAARERLNDIEIAENLRCAVDLVGLLSEHEVEVADELWKARRKTAVPQEE